ncbi:peptidoglycan-binding protein [Clostridium sp. SHJSY1]|uniref:peptidoglycan recognition protein family protein n=1 Tax=Clostridium sp. SHJSY1 TaxID=2942483 RepID=UPI002874E435|nr:peptidoglycan-binding protein [Clostridium sp. SHJSY1]MDS0524998.1 peptidoglycan-binding protein [Clostridium sp. SHJSY1]
MFINKEFISSRNCYNGQNNPKYIVNHETDNYDEGAGARKHAMAQYDGNIGEASVHYYVDDKEIYQCLELEDGAWAVGDSGNKGIITNRNSINIEICVNPDSDFYIARKNAAWLNSYLLNCYNFSVDMVKTHYDATGKICPRQMINDPKLWNEFLCFIEPSKEFNTLNNFSLSLLDKGKLFVGNRCKELQEKLISKGYNCGGYGADGIFGEGTLYSLLKFQKDNGLESDGLAGERTFNVLDTHLVNFYGNNDIVRELQEEFNKQGFGPVIVDGILGEKTLSHCPIVSEGAKGNITSCIQKMINILGYNVNVDGCFGEETKNAIIDIQKKNNLIGDGIVGENTWGIILK